ncbi:MAG TPA: hypothetical protein VFO19_19735, partial [Vicinamibacterales bacterium]|nr:hypothetical protein [Vicinamibacterales bacterium]
MNRPQLTAFTGLILIVGAGVFLLRIAGRMFASNPPGLFSESAQEILSSPVSWITVISTTATVMFLVVRWLFGKYLWRVLPAVIAPRPLLAGTWRVRVTPYLFDPATQKEVESQEPIDGFMLVQQTYFWLRMKLVTERTQSDLKGDHIEFDDNRNVYTVWAVYECLPDGPAGDDNIYHLGGMKLGPGPRTSTMWNGSYFMNRTLLVRDDATKPTRGGRIELFDRRDH